MPFVKLLSVSSNRPFQTLPCNVRAGTPPITSLLCQKQAPYSLCLHAVQGTTGLPEGGTGFFPWSSQTCILQEHFTMVTADPPVGLAESIWGFSQHWDTNLIALRSETPTAAEQYPSSEISVSTLQGLLLC